MLRNLHEASICTDRRVRGRFAGIGRGKTVLFCFFPDKTWRERDRGAPDRRRNENAAYSCRKATARKIHYVAQRCVSRRQLYFDRRSSVPETSRGRPETGFHSVDSNDNNNNNNNDNNNCNWKTAVFVTFFSLVRLLSDFFVSFSPTSLRPPPHDPVEPRPSQFAARHLHPPPPGSRAQETARTLAPKTAVDGCPPPPGRTGFGAVGPTRDVSAFE